MFKTWNIVDNLLSRDTLGHHLWEPKLLIAELRRRQADVRVLGHRLIRADDFPGAGVVPAFPLHHEALVSRDAKWGQMENFSIHNLEYQRALNKIDRSLFNGALTLFLNVSHRHLLGGTRWLARFEASNRPSVAMILKAQTNWSTTNEDLAMYGRIWKGLPLSIRRHVKVCTRSEMSAQKYDHILGLRPHVLPSALGPTEHEIRRLRERIGPQTGPLVVSFLAGARRERGTALIPDVVRQCEPLGVRFLIQATDALIDDALLASLKALRGRPEVHFHEGPLSREEYNDWIARSVVLLPYDAGRYQSRSSGVYLEARCLGSPLIVSSGSWMTDEVARLGNGLVFEEYNAASIVRCIARAQVEIATLRERAAACAAEYRQQHGADRCLDAIEELFKADQAA